MRIEVELFFQNKKIKDNLIINFDEHLAKWFIQTEKQDDLNEILRTKSFLNEKDIINFLNKHKYKFDRNKFKELKKPHIKSFVFNFKEIYGWSGGDDLDNIDIILLKFKGKNAYFYTTEHDEQYSGFHSFWKSQHEWNNSEMWEKIFELDKNGYICFNDIYDKYDNEYNRLSESFDNDEENENSSYEYEDVVAYAKKKLNENESLIIEFCHKYISLLDRYDDETRHQSSKFVLKCIVDLYLDYPDFYDKEINISDENLDELESLIGKTKSVLKRKRDLLKEQILIQPKKEKTRKI